MEDKRIVELALEALEKQRMAVDEEINELTAQMKRGDHIEPAAVRRSRKSGPQSAAARRAVSVRMKAYWAARRKAQAAKAAPAKPTRKTMSAAAKKAISRKMKLAWAKRKAAWAPKKLAKSQQSVAARKAQSVRMKEIWAKRKAAAKKSSYFPV